MPSTPLSPFGPGYDYNFGQGHERRLEHDFEHEEGYRPGQESGQGPAYGYGHGYGYNHEPQFSQHHTNGHDHGEGHAPGRRLSPSYTHDYDTEHIPRVTILDLPREVIRLIALNVYDPLELTQQDRLTWGIFSTVDMHQERQDDLADLINLGMVSRKIRREVRRVLFSCIRIPSVDHAMEVVRHREGWARYVKSIIIDLNMFDLDDNANTRPRLSVLELNQDDRHRSQASGDSSRPSLSNTHQASPASLNTAGPASGVGVEAGTRAGAVSVSGSGNGNGAGVGTGTRPRSDTSKQPRSCWTESSLLTSLLNSLPSLNHLSFFADASDDSTLALLFASLITHPSLHAVPPPMLDNSPSALSTISISNTNHNTYSYATTNAGRIPYQQTFIPLTHRLKSFGWRQRATPPNLFRQFSQTSTFVSTLHLIRHAHNLSFLVLDADMDEMTKKDVLAVVKELSLRKTPMGQQPIRLSLMLCGPINGWEDGFLKGFTEEFGDCNIIKELFVDRPLKKSTNAHATSFEAFTTVLRPLEELPYLRLLQIGSYTFTSSLQSQIALHLAKLMPSLLVLGLLGEEGETNWWGIWRRASYRGCGVASTTNLSVRRYDANDKDQSLNQFQAQTLPRRQEDPREEGHGENGQGSADDLPEVDIGIYDEANDIRIKYLADGDLRRLEDEVEEWVRSHPPTPPRTMSSGVHSPVDVKEGADMNRHVGGLGLEHRQQSGQDDHWNDHHLHHHRHGHGRYHGAYNGASGGENKEEVDIRMTPPSSVSLSLSPKLTATYMSTGDPAASEIRYTTSVSPTTGFASSSSSTSHLISTANDRTGVLGLDFDSHGDKDGGGGGGGRGSGGGGGSGSGGGPEEGQGRKMMRLDKLLD